LLRLRVTKVGQVQRLANNDWLTVEGLTLKADGTPASNTVRQAVVRLKALPTAIQRLEGPS